MSFVAENRAWLEPYVRDIIRAMKLDHWHISLEDEWPEEGGTADACAWRAKNYNRARLYLRPEDPSDAYELRWNIVHEFVHLLTRDWDRAAASLKEHLNPAAWHIAEARLDHEMEQAVEAIAFAWAEALPLPPIPDAQEAA